MQELDLSKPEPHLLPRGIDSFITYANRSEPVDFGEQLRIFEAIAEAATIRAVMKDADFDQELDDETLAYLHQVDEERHRLAWSFMPLVISRAYAMIRLEGATRLEDYVQSGIEGLYDAIEQYARKEDKRAFAPYARPVIDHAMRSQRNQDMFNTEVTRALLNTMYAYLSAEREVAAGRRDGIDLKQIGKSTEASSASVRGALALVATYRSGEGFPEDYEPEVADMSDLTLPTYDTLVLSPTLEKALLMLPRKESRYLQQHFGLRDDEPTLTLEEIAEAEGLAGTESVRSRLRSGIQNTRIVLQSFEAHGTDFDQWPDKRFLKTFNVLTYLYKVGVDIPPDMTVQELCVLAMKDLSERDAAVQDKQIVADMYGLHFGEKLTIKQLQAQHGWSLSYFSQIAREVMLGDKKVSAA